MSAVGLIAASTLAAAPIAWAAGGTTIYVGRPLITTQCSDTAAGAGSVSTPFCTVQAAVDIVRPGDTIVVAPGTFAPFSISASGTATAPITITSSGAAVQSTDSEPAVTVTGANYLNLIGVRAIAAIGPAVSISGSSHITFDSGEIFSDAAADTQPAFHVTGGSSYVTVSRSMGSSTSLGALIAVDGGGSGDVITTNLVNSSRRAPAIAVDGASTVAITSNTVQLACGTAIQITGGSTATVENNVVRQMVSAHNGSSCAVQPADTRALVVDATSAVGSSADYNDFDASFAGPGAQDYSWAGTSYATPAALTAATGQGARDASAPDVPNPATMSGSSPAYIDSANANAPGELSTDYLGHSRVDDPVVPDTGIGVHTYYDRGATELQAGQPSSIMTLSGPGGTVSTAPVGGSITFTGTVQDPWDSKLTCAIDFGDGTSTTVAASGTLTGTCVTTHQYAATGHYVAALAVAYSDGSNRTFTYPVAVDAPAPVVPSLTLYPLTSVAVTPVCGGTSGWNIDNYLIDFGDGSTAGCGPHAYQKPGTYTVTMTATDAGGNSATTSTSFSTAGDYYTPLTPSRILDTRNGTGTGSAQKVAANGVLKLKVAGAGGLPTSGVAAVVLNVTVTRPSAGGYVTVYPDGVTRPGTSNLNFSAGQTVPNTVIVRVGADGAIDLANGSGGTTDLVADVEGYYSLDGTSGYVVATPVRVLDTRVSKTTLAPGGTARVYFGSYSNPSAVTLNVTVANAKQGGYITAYPDGGSTPTASNVNFAVGQITQNEAIAKVGADGYVDFTNSSTGSTDLIVDMNGYFQPGAGMAFVPITPARLVDTRRGDGVWHGAVPAFQDLYIATSGYGAITPGTAGAVAANITVTDPKAGGYITAYPYQMGKPLTSVVNFAPGQTVPNATTVGTGFDDYRNIDLYNGSGGSVQLIFDAFGFYS